MADFFMMSQDQKQLGCDIGGAKELGVMYFPTNWGAKEPQNLPNHRVDKHVFVGRGFDFIAPQLCFRAFF